jgi:hypothetical protein
VQSLKWLLPYGIHRQLRQAWARRNAVRQQDEAQMTGGTLDPQSGSPARLAGRNDG